MPWLLVGTGDIVRKRVAPALQGNIAAVVGERSRAEAVAREFGAGAAYEDLGEALRHCDAPSVYVATAVDRHRPVAVQALAAGRHVLVEKPLGLNFADAGAIAAAARESGLQAGCAYYRRFFPRYTHLQQLLAARTLGRIVLVRLCYWSWFNPAPDDPKRWRVEKNRSGGGPLMDMGSHMFDQLIGLFGMPMTVYAKCDTLAQDYAVEDSASMVMTMRDGAHVTANVGWHSQTWRHEVEVVGTAGKVLWSPADTGKVQLTIGRDTQELDLPNAANVHQPLVDDFVAAVREGRAPAVTVAQALLTNQLLDAVYHSSRERREVGVT